MIALVMAGGSSRRFKRDKRLVDLDGETMFARTVHRVRPVCDRVFAAVDATAALPALPGVCFLRDRVCDQGPWPAVADVMEELNEDVLVVAVDLPRLTSGFLRTLVLEAREEARETAPAIVAVSGSKLEPLVAVYRQTFLRDLRRVATQGGSLRRHLEQDERVQTVDVPQSEMLFNWNFPLASEGVT